MTISAYQSSRTLLKDGDKVKATVMFRGREIQHSDLAETAQADGNGSTGTGEVQQAPKKKGKI